MGKARKIIFTVLTAVILIPVTLSVVLQFPSVQTGLLRFVGEKISRSIDGDISRDAVRTTQHPGRLVVIGIEGVH